MEQPVAPALAAVPVAAPAVGSPRRGRGCLLVGCIVLVLLVAVPLAAVWALYEAAENAPPPRSRHADSSHPLPGTGEVRVVLDCRMGNLEVVPAPAGAPLRLRADWDDAAFRLTDSLRPEGDGWVYDVGLRPRGLRFLRVGGEQSVHNHLRLELPAGHPLALAGKLAMGQSDLALGGLALRSIDLDLTMGEHRLSFGDATAAPLDLLRLRGGMGELTVLRAGNASPRRIEVRHRMGELTLDLAGAWRNDGEVEIGVGMGDGEVQLPAVQEAHSVVEEAHMALGGAQVHERREAGLPAPPGLPTVRIRARGGMGDLEIR